MMSVIASPIVTLMVLKWCSRCVEPVDVNSVTSPIITLAATNSVLLGLYAVYNPYVVNTILVNVFWTTEKLYLFVAWSLYKFLSDTKQSVKQNKRLQFYIGILIMMWLLEQTQENMSLYILFKFHPLAFFVS
jgi:hypothetical protein